MDIRKSPLWPYLWYMRLVPGRQGEGPGGQDLGGEGDV